MLIFIYFKTVVCNLMVTNSVYKTAIYKMLVVRFIDNRPSQNMTVVFMPHCT